MTQENKNLPINLSTIEIERTIKSWLTDDMRAQTARYFELGKFLFSVSAGSMLFFVTALEALGKHACSPFYLMLALAALFLATLVSIVFVWPRRTLVNTNLDIIAEYTASMAFNRSVLVGWLILLVIGLGCGFLAITEFGPACTFASKFKE